MGRKRVVLFGAGLSANWGGLLAKDVGSLLYSYMRGYDCRDKEYLITDETYEQGWSHVLTVNRESHKNLKRQLEDNLVRVFEFQHPILRSNAAAGAFANIGKFLKDILTFQNNIGWLVLTTNQDVLLDEVRVEQMSFSTPGMETIGYRDERTLKKRDVPDRCEPMGFSRHAIPLLKIHGSFDWRQNNRPVLVTGASKNKSDFPPFLQDTLDWLEAWLRDAPVDLIIIGHAMQDNYLVKLLSAHCTDSWRVFIVDKMNPHDWFRNKKHFRQTALMARLECYLPQEFGALIDPSKRKEAGYLTYISEIRDPIIGL